jgi:hypothetical protein
MTAPPDKPEAVARADVGAPVEASGYVQPLRSGRHYLVADGRSVVPVGVHFVPIQGPDWPWRVGVEVFDEAFERIAALGLDSVRIDVLWTAVEPVEGEYDERHLAQLDAIVEAARRHGLRLHPALFIGGEVGDAVWDVPWRDGRHPHADADMRALAAAHAGMLARRWAGDAAILAWDLTDEPPIWLFQDTSDDDARAWTAALVRAIRASGARQPITIGTASQEVDHGPFRADVVGGELDFVCVHPYPIYSPELYPDALMAPRMTHAAAFETALAAGAGRPAMVHEYGASSAQFDPALVAAYDRLLAWSSFGRGAMGFYPWCWTDAEPDAYDRAPYVRMPHETQFGVTDWRGEPRPRAGALVELGATLARLDLDAYAANGPEAGAALLVPHEYAHPYDPESYGLGRAPAGPYKPAERAWTPERDVKPLVRAWLNAFVMAARAGFSVAFPREALSGDWPRTRLLLLPAPLTTTTNSLWHVRTSFWQRSRSFLAAGGTVYLSCSGDTSIPELAELAGCRLLDRAACRERQTMRFVESWGPLRTGDKLILAGAGERGLNERAVRLAAEDARVIAVDADGDPALLVAQRGAGHVVTCAIPVELLAASVPDAHGSDDRSFALYTGLADLAQARDDAGTDHPELTTGTLTGTAGGTLVITNHGPSDVHAALRLPDSAHNVALVTAEGSATLADQTVSVGPYGVVVVTWRG